MRRRRVPRSPARTTALQALSYYGRTILVLGDLPSDNADMVGHVSSTSATSIATRSPPTTPRSRAMWDAIYDAIDRDNVIIAKVPTLTNIASPTQTSILGEAYFLRALHYHNLVKFWGDVPHAVLAPLASANDASQHHRTPMAQRLHADPLRSRQGRAADQQHRQHASGIAGARRWRCVRACCCTRATIRAHSMRPTPCIAMGYSLAPTYADLFTANGTDTPEDIFRVIFTAAGVQRDGLLLSRFRPS